jgi:hypothetical protein
MKSEHQQRSPPPAYDDHAPGGMESEMYIDGTLCIDGVALDRAERRKRSKRSKPNQDNPCAILLRWIRSYSDAIIFNG